MAPTYKKLNVDELLETLPLGDKVKLLAGKGQSYTHSKHRTPQLTALPLCSFDRFLEFQRRREAWRTRYSRLGRP